MSSPWTFIHKHRDPNHADLRGCWPSEADARRYNGLVPVPRSAPRRHARWMAGTPSRPEQSPSTVHQGRCMFQRVRPDHGGRYLAGTLKPEQKTFGSYQGGRASFGRLFDDARFSADFLRLVERVMSTELAWRRAPLAAVAFFLEFELSRTVTINIASSEGAIRTT